MEALINNLIHATGWSILHSIWQGALIYATLLFLVLCLPRLTARTKHNLAFAAMFITFAGFLTTFIYLFKLPAWNYLLGAEHQNVIFYTNHLSTFTENINSQTEHIFPFLVGVYFIGMLFQLTLMISGYYTISKLKHTGYTAVPDHWMNSFETIVPQLNLSKRIGFYLSSHVNVPVVIGYFKPLVLFPLSLASQLDINQVEAILIHELSHIRRNDYLLNLIKKAVETVMFFNPFIWLSGKFIQIERENACDDIVLKLTGTPLTYAHALLKLELLKMHKAPQLSLAATGHNQHLYERIKRITDMKTNYISAKQQLFAFTLIIATIVSLAWINPLKKDKKGELLPKLVKSKVQKLVTHRVIAASTNITKINYTLNQDTSKKKTRIKIVTVDAKGKKREYNSVKELPDPLKQQLIIGEDSLSQINLTYLNSPEFKNHVIELRTHNNDIVNHFTSPEWKKQQKEIMDHALSIDKKIRTLEFKKQQMDVFKNAEDIRKRFNSLEFRKQQQHFKKNAEEIRKQFSSPEWRKQQIEIRNHFNSPDWKKQMEETQKLKSSPEYKMLKEKFDKDLDEIKRKKGIKTTDSTVFFISPLSNINMVQIN